MMNTKILMTLSAVTLALAGIALTFAPEEILLTISAEGTPALILILQLLGALYFGFGMLNWMTKTGRIGGIYNRPVAVANFSHYAIAGLALMKSLTSVSDLPTVIWVVAIVYAAFAVAFGALLFWNPLKSQN
ncbi:MAG: hypothetical protein RIC30_07525 [Marinoscillum sp.]|uniref:hypothetical protein n=1 Tax=Marinoscillum sp. TaxID=2024838 RepID=UPI0032FBEB7E